MSTSTPGKTVLITGASAGMGKDFALRLLALGFTVYGAARRVDRMDDLVAAGGHAIAMDITQEADVLAAVARIEEEAGGVDILINNAGFGLYGSVEDTPLDDARYQFEVNLFGLARLTQRVLPGMRAKGAGKVLNISSVGGKIYTPLGAWYHATKHALEGWSDCLRLEVAPFGIDVVVIEPGAIATEWGDIMSDGLAKRSGEGAYAGLVKRLQAAREARYGQDRSSPASVVTDAVVKAITARRPRTRYRAGAYSWVVPVRAWVGDRTFDKLIMGQAG